MSGLAKRLLVRALTPLARLATIMGEPGRRVWAHARLRASITGPVGPSVVIMGVAEVRGAGRIELGRNLFLYPGLYLETQEPGRIVIGDDVVMSRGVHVVAFQEIQIGPGTMIGEYASLRDANHRFSADQPIRRSGHDAAPIRIGRNVWIGRGVTVLPGVTIGDGAVIGANAVVTRDVGPGAVMVGVPARPL
ncbi:MAG TPA: acyltransferase [Candidatus Competibacter sp.]|nr:acyltransferase [Candidatus Competibacter sp.]